MIIKMITWLIIVAIYYFVFKFYARIYQKSDSIYEKILYVILLFIWFVPSVIYVFDSYNIPSKIGYLKNVESNRWFGFISQYVGAIAGSVVSGTILLMITFWQNDEQKKSFREELRVNNLPLFDYKINTDENNIENKKICTLMNSFDNDGWIYSNFSIIFNNLGLNHAKDVKFEVKKADNYFSSTIEFGFIKANEIACLVISYPYNKNQNDFKKKIEIELSYSDLLNNKYLKKIYIDIYINAEENKTYIDGYIIKDCK